MDKAVNHEHNNPVYYKRDLVFTKLVVDKWVTTISIQIWIQIQIIYKHFIYQRTHKVEKQIARQQTI